MKNSGIKGDSRASFCLAGLLPVMLFLSGCVRIPEPGSCSGDESILVSGNSFLPRAFSENKKSPHSSLAKRESGNPAPWIPVDCYADTEREGRIENSCYICHTAGKGPWKLLDDRDLQTSFRFPDGMTENHWTNVLKIPEPLPVEKRELLRILNMNNYLDLEGKPVGPIRSFNERVDASYRFDVAGFDLNREGQKTGWRAFFYRPLPGFRIPGKGTGGDVLIRLPVYFQQDSRCRKDDAVYRTNLEIVEQLVKMRRLHRGTIEGIEFAGRAGFLQRRGWIKKIAGLLPVGTEFLHTLRYPFVDESTGGVRFSLRRKEVRYSRKIQWQTLASIQTRLIKKAREKYERGNPGIEPWHPYRNGSIITDGGWFFQGWIENQKGLLRLQNHEEMESCIGCHTGIGLSVDSVISLPRKLEGGESKGWGHFSREPFPDIGDFPVVLADGRKTDEVSFFLEQNPGFLEARKLFSGFRNSFNDRVKNVKVPVENSNLEMRTFYLAGREKLNRINQIYLKIVRNQSFDRGRDLPGENLSFLKNTQGKKSTGIVIPVLTGEAIPSSGE